MKRVIGIVLLASCVLVLAPARAQDLCAEPRCRDIEVPVPVGLIVPDSRVRVLLPDGYDPDGAGYPVLYLLHGAGDTYATWSMNTDVVEWSRGMPVIIVMPDGGRNADAGWYSDWADGSRQWETFHTEILVDYIDANFNTLGDGHRAVAGLSMGGFGAMHYAARHPGLFAAAASFSGAVDTMFGWPVSGVAYTQLHEMFGTPDDRVWGSQLTNGEEWRANNPADLAAELRCTPLFLATGTGTPGGPAGDDLSNPGGYAIEVFILQLNVSFLRALTVAGVPSERDFYPGGYHGWPYWERELHWALPQILPIIQGVAPPYCNAA